MQLQIPTNLLANYKSPSQRARVATEAWAAEELFCPSCPSNSLNVLPNNTRGRDFDRPRCSSSFQLKSQSKHFTTRIVNSEYHTAIREILEDRTPNLFALEYNRNSWKVENLFLIPHFAFSELIVVPRKPLGPNARRAGCSPPNYILGAIAPDARMSYVRDGKPVAPKIVREKFAALRPLEELSIKERGWTLDVLNAIRSLRRPDFTLAEAYSFENRLGALHPNNRHIRDKIRQQLQVLRDAGLLDFTARGIYRLRPTQ